MSPQDRATTVLFAWFSPAFPIGAFAFSHGLEAAVADGLLDDEAGLSRWIRAILTAGGPWTDAVLLRAAFAATAARAWASLAEIAALARALSPSGERLRETLAQGEAFARAVAEGWPGMPPDELGPRAAYPVVAGAALCAIGAPVEGGLIAYLNGFASNLIAVGIRLGLCGQSGGLRILSALGPVIARTAERAAASSLEDLGARAFGADIASMRHETLQPRIFVS